VWAYQEHQHMAVNLHYIGKIAGSLQSLYGFHSQLSIAHSNPSYDYESTNLVDTRVLNFIGVHTRLQCNHLSGCSVQWTMRNQD